MHRPADQPRSAGVSGRVLAALAALAGALLAAFVLAPPAIAASSSGGFDDQRHLSESFRAAFVEYWNAGARDFTPGLEAVVDSWFRFHVAKAVIAALLLAVLVALGAALWRTFLRAGGLGAGRRAAVTVAGVAVTVLSLLSTALVMANVQGAAAPFASLLPMLQDGTTGGTTDTELAGTLDQIRQQLAADPAAPGLDGIIDDYADYHTAMAIIAAIAAAVLIGISVMSWRRFARTSSPDPRTRRAAAAFGVLMALSALAVTVVAVANATTAADPVPGLVAFFDGSW